MKEVILKLPVLGALTDRSDQLSNPISVWAVSTRACSWRSNTGTSWERIFLFAAPSSPVLPTGIKQPGREADHSP